MKNKLSRRDFLKLSGILGAGTALLNSGLATFAQEDVILQWWDHFGNLPELQRELWDTYNAQHPNIFVEHTQINPSDLGQALQLAFPNGEAPDVHSTAGIGVPTSRLIEDGWFVAWDDYVGQEWIDSLPAGALTEGSTVFGGKIYSIPIFSFRTTSTLTWFNKELMENAGYDPEIGPQSWDEFRDAARKITENGGGSVFGWIQGISFTDRLADHTTNLAMTAGAPSKQFDWRTGEYIFASEPVIQAVEFLKSLEQDGSLLPGSGSLNARTARARWVTGIAGLFFDGPWNIGTVNREFQDFLPKIGVTRIVAPEPDADINLHVGPQGGSFFVSSQSEHPEIAIDILKNYATQAFYEGVASMMTPPPLDLSVVDNVDVHPTYRTAMEHFGQDVFLDPIPAARNPLVSDVYANMADVRPNLGEIVQGVISGDVTDIAGTLQEYNDKLTAERDAAIATVQAEGGDVSLDDWVFEDWESGQDYFTS